MSELISEGPFVGLVRNGYNAIVCDPPWLFRTYSEKGKGKSPDRHYRCMSIDDICALPVADLAAPNCALLMWCTWPTLLSEVPYRLPDGSVALQPNGKPFKQNVVNKVIDAWGFKYSGLAWEWLKYNEATDKFAFGPGYGTRKNCEPVILARKGSPEVLSRSERDFMFAKRRRHSEKPDETHAKVQRLYGGAYCELFARKTVPGWTCWGDQVGLLDPTTETLQEAA